MISSPVWQVEFTKLHERLPCPFTMRVPRMTFTYDDHIFDTALYCERAMKAFRERRKTVIIATTEQTVQ